MCFVWVQYIDLVSLEVMQEMGQYSHLDLNHAIICFAWVTFIDLVSLTGLHIALQVNCINGWMIIDPSLEPNGWASQ